MIELISVTTGIMLWDHARFRHPVERAVLQLCALLMIVWGTCAALLELLGGAA